MSITSGEGIRRREDMVVMRRKGALNPLEEAEAVRLGINEDFSRAEDEVYRGLVFKYRRGRPTIDDFSFHKREGGYDPNEIARDMAWVKERREGYERDARGRREMSGRGELLEAIISDQVDRAQWLGDDCLVFATTEYDDQRGADFVAEWQDEETGEQLHLAVDITVSERLDNLGAKISTIERGLKGSITRDGRVLFLSDVKYFSSPHDEEERVQPLSRIPRVVIGVGRAEVKRLSEITARVLRKEQGSNQELGNDYLQLLLLEEITCQLREQALYVVKAFIEAVIPDAETFHTYDADTADALTEFVEQFNRVSVPATEEQYVDMMESLARYRELFESISSSLGPISREYLHVLDRIDPVYRKTSDVYRQKKSSLARMSGKGAANLATARRTDETYRYLSAPQW